MLPAKWLPARARRAALCRIAAILAATAATLPATPASAVRYYGFIETLDSPPAKASRGAETEPQLFHTRAVAIPTNRFADSWVKLVNAVAAARLPTLCNDPGT